MTLLIVAIAVISVFAPLWFLLTREPKRRIRTKRAWTWRRVTIRAVDRLVIDANSGGKLVLLATFAPLIIYMFTAPILGFRWSPLGMMVSGGLSLVLVAMFTWRAWKWMRRSVRSSRDWLRKERLDRSKPSRAIRQSRAFKFGRKFARFKHSA